MIHSRFDEARNAMDPASADALVDAFKAFDTDASANVAVLWGEGGAFCLVGTLNLPARCRTATSSSVTSWMGWPSPPEQTLRLADRWAPHDWNCPNR